MKFYLGTHQPSHMTRTSVPLFVSRRRLFKTKRLPRAAGPWALDSGGFTELQMYGAWCVPARRYAAEVRRYSREIGGLEWVSPQDWMCEPPVLQGGWWRNGRRVRRGTKNAAYFVGTNLSVEDHQRRTVRNYMDLMAIAPDVPWVPVLQGWTLTDYRRCADMYADAGVDLEAARLVGVGSICRRQHSAEASAILFALSAMGLRLHAYGLKLGGLKHSAGIIASADSMAWSYDARRNDPLPGCTGHKNCANCLRYALTWHEKVRKMIDTVEPDLFTCAPCAGAAHG